MTNKYIEKVAQIIVDEVEKQAGLASAGKAILGNAKALASAAKSKLSVAGGAIKREAKDLKNSATNLRLATGKGGKMSVMKAIAKNRVAQGAAAGVAAAGAGAYAASRRKDD